MTFLMRSTIEESVAGIEANTQQGGQKTAVWNLDIHRMGVMGLCEPSDEK
jgi:hypothetical protein